MKIITEYVTDVSRWNTWQQEYRYGVILIFPPDPPKNEMNDLRTVYDPIGQSFCEVHISLTVPLPGPMNDEQLKELLTIASSFKPFSVHYGPLSNYLPHPGVVLTIEPKDRLENLMTTLEKASVFENAAERPWPFSPHMTITELFGMEDMNERVDRTKELMVELEGKTPEGDFLCDYVSYAVPDEDFHFTERARLELGKQH